MLKAFFFSKRWFWWAYGGGLLLLLLSFTQVYMSVRFNRWYGGFYDMLQKIEAHTVQEYWAILGQFMWIAIPYIVIATVMNYISRLYAFGWREAITFDYIPRWRHVTEEIEGASQRIQEDTAKFARIVESLGLQALNSVMTLVAFVPILWGLSKGVNFWILKDIPGSLLWVALVVSLGGMGISWIVGIKLPGLEYNNQKVEARFRKELVYGEDDKVNHAAIPTLTELFIGIKKNYYRLYMHYGYVDGWLNVYSQCMIIVPFVIAGPSLFSGIVTLGVMMQIVNSFGEVRSSLAIFINNWTTITELRSIRKRLHEFECNLDRHQ